MFLTKTEALKMINFSELPYSYVNEGKSTSLKPTLPYFVFLISWFIVTGIAEYLLPHVTASTEGTEQSVKQWLWRIYFREVPVHFLAIITAAFLAVNFGNLRLKYLVPLVVVVWGVIFAVNMVMLDRLNPDPTYAFFSWAGFQTYEYWPMIIFQFVGVAVSALVAGAVVNHITRHSTRTPTS